MYEDQRASGKKILVVENDFVDELKIAVEVFGSRAAGRACVKDQTIAILRGSDIGAAIVDSRLDREQSTQIADALATLGIPFVFADTKEPSLLPEHLSLFSMTESSPELNLIAQQLFGRPTYH